MINKKYHFLFSPSAEEWLLRHFHIIKSLLSHTLKRRKGFVFRGTTLFHLIPLSFAAAVSNALISSVTGSSASAYSCSAVLSSNTSAAHNTFTKRTQRPVQSFCFLPRTLRQFSEKHMTSTIPYLRLSYIPVYYKKIIRRSQEKKNDSDYPRATSSIIINVNPMATPIVPIFVCFPI